ncbi:MAG: type I pullulanase [Eubacteriales bacterium]
MNQNEELVELNKMFYSKEFEEEYTYKGMDLGATVTKTGTIFKVWSPTASEVLLHLYKSGEEDSVPYESKAMKQGSEGVWELQSSKCLDGTYYTYEITARNENLITGDIYAKACGANGKRSMVVDLASTNPKGFEEDSYCYDSTKQPIIYEVHVKDFSYDQASGVEDTCRGKYLAFTKEGTCLDLDCKKPTCVEYLKKLGITHVHLLPMYDYGSVDELGSDEQFNWGYDPVNYNVPEGSYATNPRDGRVRIQEVKEMIQALHKAEIGVIMDVVYNHTYSTDSYFQRTVPYYYYRMDKNGTFADGSACSNETASERSMFRKYMIDSVVYLAKEYHFDGFRFDLMGLHDVDTMNEIRSALDALPNGKQVLVYGEPWAASPPAMKEGVVPADKAHLHLLESNIAIFSDDTRDAIKGSVFFEKESGYVNGTPELAKQIPNVVCAWDNPSQIVSYVSAHDNFTLYDKLVLSMKEERDFTTIQSDLLQVNKLCASMVMTSCGYTFFQAGEEFARTKNGIGDSYNSSPKVNCLDWKRAYENEDLVTFYQDLIAFRKSIPIFMNRNGNPREEIQFVEQQVPYVVSFLVIDENNKRCFIVYNPNEQEVEVTLPIGKWEVLCNGERFLQDSKEMVEDRRNVSGKSAVIVREW